MSPFLGQPTIAPPPLHRTPPDVSVQLSRSPGGHGALGARTVFNTIGRLCEVSIEGRAAVVIELGEIEEGWRFVVRGLPDMRPSFCRVFPVVVFPAVTAFQASVPPVEESFR